LTAAGMRAVPIVVYDNLEVAGLAQAPFPVGAVFVASPSAARRLLSANPWMRQASFVAIGPTTARCIETLDVARITISGPAFDDQLQCLMEAAAENSDLRGNTPSGSPA